MKRLDQVDTHSVLEVGDAKGNILSNESSLYIHIGTVKTGTTYLQRLLYENRNILHRYGLRYPYVTPPDLHLPRYANANFLYDRSHDESACKILSDKECPNTIISEEGIFGSIQLLKHPALSIVPKRIILYVRKPAELILSWASEVSEPYNVYSFIENDGLMSIPETIEKLSDRYEISARRFLASLEEIGVENVIVRPYERESFKSGDLFTDFMDCMGLDATAINADPEFKDPGRTNVSRSRKFCDISNEVWQILGKPTRPREFNINMVEDIVDACKSGDKRDVLNTVSDEVIGRITNRFQFFEDAISARLLNNRPLFVDRYPKIFGKKRPDYQPIDVIELRAALKRYQDATPRRPQASNLVTEGPELEKLRVERDDAVRKLREARRNPVRHLVFALLYKLRRSISKTRNRS